MVVKAFQGIWNRIEGYRRKFNNKAGSIHLWDAQNCMLDDSGQIQTRPGYTIINSSPTHSLWSDGSIMLGVISGNLCSIDFNHSHTATILRSQVGTSTRMNYVKVGAKIYCTNSRVIGYVEDGTWNDLPAVTDTYKLQMPPGHLIEWYKGRLYVAVGPLILWSEPGGYHYFDEREDRSFLMLRSRVTLLSRADNGLWISDQDQVYFWEGDDPETEMKVIPRGGAPAIEGTSVKTFSPRTDQLPPLQRTIFTTTTGICYGDAAGYLTQLTEDYYTMPSTPRSGVAGLMTGTTNQYISILK